MYKLSWNILFQKRGRQYPHLNLFSPFNDKLMIRGVFKKFVDCLYKIKIP